MDKTSLVLGLNGYPLAREIAEIDDVYFVRIHMKSGVTYSMPWPAKHMSEQGGFLRGTLAAAALWYFLQCAAHAVEQIPNQVVLEGEDDSQLDLRNLVDSIIKCYDVTILQMFSDENVRRAKAELERVGGKIDPRIIAYIESGGQVYRHHDREPQ